MRRSIGKFGEAVGSELGCWPGFAGQPVAELVPARRKPGFPFGIARDEPLAPAGDAWWQPLSDAEAEDWIQGQ